MNTTLKYQEVPSEDNWLTPLPENPLSQKTPDTPNVINASCGSPLDLPKIHNGHCLPWKVEVAFSGLKYQGNDS